MVYLKYSETQTDTAPKFFFVKLSFKDELPNMSGKTIRVWTDKIGGWVMKHEILATQLLSNKPYIELICIDETNKTLESDIIR